MAQYNTFQYNDGTLYGSSAIAKATQTWIVNVDWNGDGSYDGQNDGAWLINCNIKRGREEYLNASGAGFEHMRVGTATLTFDNSTQRYDPRYAAGPLYGYLKPGRKIQISVKDNTDESVMVLFTGLIDDITPSGHADTTLIKCVDYMQWLADQELTFDAELLNTNITGALNHLLTQAQYPGGRNIASDTQPIWVFGVNKEMASSVAHAIADAGLGIFYVAADGKAVYQGRNHATGGTGFGETYFRTDIQISQPWDGVYNDVTVERLRYVKQQPSIIFTLPEAVYIANGGSQAIEVNYDPSTDIQLREIVANTRFDGEGTALTFTASSIDFGFTGGSITVANASGSNGYVTDIQIRGRKYLDTIQKYTASDATSQGVYGIRRFQLKSPFLQDGGYASAFATILKTFLKDDRESLIVKFRGYPTYEQYANDLCGGVVITSATLGLTLAEYQILGIDHDWMNDNGQDVLTTWYLHKVLNNTDVITSSSLETAPPVPPAPPGYDDPGGDPDTIDSTNQDDIPPTSPLSGSDHIIVIGSEVDSTSKIRYYSSSSNSGYVEFASPSFVGEDVTLADVWTASRADKVFLTEDGWYEVSVSGYFDNGTGVSTTESGVQITLETYEADGGAGHAVEATSSLRMDMNFADKVPYSFSSVFPRTIVGSSISYIRLKLENLYPSPIATFFTNSRKVVLFVTVKRIRRPVES